MSNFDEDLKKLLSEQDAIDETGYYQSVIKSFKGQSRFVSILSWIGITVICILLFYFIWKFFHAETTRDQILFAALVIMMNSAQIALKLWYNMQLNRRTITRDIKLLQLTLAKAMKET